MRGLPAFRPYVTPRLLAALAAGALVSAASNASAEPPTEEVAFYYNRISLPAPRPKSSNWIRNGQPHTSSSSGDALADLPQVANGRIPPHTPDIKLNRGVSPGGPDFPRRFESTAKNDPKPSIPPQFKVRVSGLR